MRTFSILALALVPAIYAASVITSVRHEKAVAANSVSVETLHIALAAKSQPTIRAETSHH